MMLYSILLVLLTQVTVDASGIYVGSGDVLAVLTPITSWATSFFNVIVAFAGCFIVYFFFEKLLGWLKIGK